jgi:putative membrane protein
MRGILLRLVIVGLGLALASEIVPGVEVRDGWSLVLAAVLLGIVNAVIRPIAIILTLPLTIVTLGLFLLVVNAAMLSLVAWLMDGLMVAGFWPAFFGALVVSITGWLASRFVGDRGEFVR